MSLLKVGLSVLVIIAVAIGLKFYHKASSYNDVKAQMLEFCHGVAKCETTLTTHFGTCFDDSYGLGGERRASGFDRQAFVECMNRRGGVELLTHNH